MNFGDFFKKPLLHLAWSMIDAWDNQWKQQYLDIISNNETKTDNQHPQLDIVKEIEKVSAGVTGDQNVIEIQSYLRILGFPIGNFGPNRNGVDGIMGDSTRSAMKSFTKMNGIELTNATDEQIIIAMEEKASLGRTIRDLAKAAYEQEVVMEITKTSSRAEFVNAVYYYALIDESKSLVPAAVTTSQAILESAYGKFVPTDTKSDRYSYNLFGIKGTGPAGSVNSWTREENKKTGVWEPIIARFRAYHSFEESIHDHSDFFHKNIRRYGAALKTSNPIDFAKEIAKAGYATDSKYADKLINIMKYWGMIS